jgi:hypothetical protein
LGIPNFHFHGRLNEGYSNETRLDVILGEETEVLVNCPHGPACRRYVDTSANTSSAERSSVWWRGTSTVASPSAEDNALLLNDLHASSSSSSCNDSGTEVHASISVLDNI